MENLYFENKYGKKGKELIIEKFQLIQYNDSNLYHHKDYRFDVKFDKKTISVHIYDIDNTPLIKHINNYFYEELKPSKLFTFIDNSKEIYKDIKTLLGFVSFWIIFLMIVFGGKITIKLNIIEYLSNILDYIKNIF